jgi:DNA primase
MAISPETIEEVYRTVNIYDIVSKYITLQKTGSNYRALCPFHSEKTPSFFISPSKNIFKCFGCGKAGDSVKFLMEYKGISFADAIIEIAQHYGIPIKYIGDKKENKEINTLYSVAEKIAKFYQEQLKKSKKGKEYVKKRRLLPSTIETFSIGYSPEKISELLNFAKKENITIEQLKEIGILKEVAIGKYVDRFKDRIIFPIRNHLGKVVAFGGRAISGEGKIAKYLNSPETKIYNKSKTLYGFFESRDYIREKKSVIIVEGYFDLLSMYQVGFRNIVATLGTAFTLGHGKLLKKFVEKAYIMFDSDRAGKEAAIKSAKILLSLDIDVYYIPLEDKDPDELAKKGRKEVENVINQAKNIFEFLIEKIRSAENLKEKEKLINIYMDLINHIPNKVKAGLLIKELAKITGISEKYLETKQIEREFYEESNKLDLKLSKKEKIVIKALLNYREEILKNFKNFDKIKGSEYFNYLINEILENKPLEEDIILHLNLSNEPYNVEIALKILDEMFNKWKKEEEKLNAVFNTDEEVLLNLINQKINSKKIKLGG